MAHVKSAKSNRRQVRQTGPPPPGAGAPERAGHHDRPGAAPPRQHRRAPRLRAAPVRGAGARRWALFGRIRAGATVAARHATAPELSVWCLRSRRISRPMRRGLRVASVAVRKLAVARRTTGPADAELAAGFPRAESAKSIGVGSATGSPSGRRRRCRARRTSRPRRGLCARAIIAVLLGCVRCAGAGWRRPPVGALRADSRWRRRSPHRTRMRPSGRCGERGA